MGPVRSVGNVMHIEAWDDSVLANLGKSSYCMPYSNIGFALLVGGLADIAVPHAVRCDLIIAAE